MLLRILLISLALSAVLSKKTINRRRLGATCHRVIDDVSCKNSSEADTCEIFADSYKSGTCEDNGYSVACTLRYGIVENYKDAASCKAAQDKALHRRAAATCHMINDDGTCKNNTEASTCTTFPDSYKSGTCEANGYSVACKLRYGIVENYKDAASCKAAQDKALHRRMAAIPCYRDSSDGSCKNAADAFTCQQFGFLMKGGTCEANGYPVVCKLGFMEVYNYKDAAACKAAQDKKHHRS